MSARKIHIVKYILLVFLSWILASVYFAMAFFDRYKENNELIRVFVLVFFLSFLIRNWKHVLIVSMFVVFIPGLFTGFQSKILNLYIASTILFFALHVFVFIPIGVKIKGRQKKRETERYQDE